MFQTTNHIYIYIYGYGSIPINTIFSGLFTSINPSYFDVNYRGTRFWHTSIYIYIYIIWLYMGTIIPQWMATESHSTTHGFPLVNIQKTMERSTIFNGKIHYKSSFSMGKSTINHHFQWENPLKMVIFNGYFDITSGFPPMKILSFPGTEEAAVGFSSFARSAANLLIFAPDWAEQKTVKEREDSAMMFYGIHLPI